MTYRCLTCGVLISGAVPPEGPRCGSCAESNQKAAQSDYGWEKQRREKEARRHAGEVRAERTVPFLFILIGATAGVALSWPDPLSLGGTWRQRVLDYGLYTMLSLGALSTLLILVFWLRSLALRHRPAAAVTRPAEPTHRDTEYAERLARKKAETAELIRSFTARADAHEREGNRELAARQVEELIARLGHVHPEVEGLRTRLEGLRR